MPEAQAPAARRSTERRIPAPELIPSRRMTSRVRGTHRAPRAPPMQVENMGTVPGVVRPQVSPSPYEIFRLRSLRFIYSYLGTSISQPCQRTNHNTSNVTHLGEHQARIPEKRVHNAQDPTWYGVCRPKL